MEQQTQRSDADHDLLVTLVAKVDAFIAGQMTSQNDHESRIRILEQANTAQQGTVQARKDISGTAKWVIGTLATFLGLAITALGIVLVKL